MKKNRSFFCFIIHVFLVCNVLDAANTHKEEPPQEETSLFVFNSQEITEESLMRKDRPEFYEEVEEVLVVLVQNPPSEDPQSSKRVVAGKTVHEFTQTSKSNNIWYWIIVGTMRIGAAATIEEDQSQSYKSLIHIRTGGCDLENLILSPENKERVFLQLEKAYNIHHGYSLIKGAD